MIWILKRDRGNQRDRRNQR
jgi:hypothetical protein